MVGEFEPILQNLTFDQKLKFIRKRLDEVPEFDTADRRGGLWFRLLHPDELNWRSNISGITALPPQEGKIRRLTVDRNLPHERRKRPIGIVLDFTRTAHLTGVSYAVFGLGALGVTEDDELVIDCLLLSKTPTTYLQYALPNFFADKEEVNQTEPLNKVVA